MSGRGRGRGSGLSLTQEQLQSLGISRGETSALTLTPPPLFPKLEAKPLPLPSDSATDYMLIVKDQFIEYLHESPAYVKPRTENHDVERYSDKYKLLALDAKKSGTLECVWANIPAELRPLARRGRTTVRKRKLDDPNEVTKRLQTLEKKEQLGESREKAQTNDVGEVKKEGESDEEQLEEEQEYEADEGTDYANNFFDNGEDYDEEDDNLDDDPVY